MKAATIHKWGLPKVFEIENIDVPVPKTDQIVVKVFASGINPVDWKHRYGHHRFIYGSPFPIVLGYDVCGEVIDTGENCKTFKKGDIVFGDLDNKYGGGLAEFCIGHEHCFALKPNNISIEQVAAASLAGLTALQALRDKGKITTEKTVVINGASGGVGHIALQIAKIFNAKVIAIASESKQDFIKSLGADEFINYTSVNPLKYLGKDEVDIFFDVIGNYSYLKTLSVLKPGGIYITTLPRLKVLIHKLLQPFTGGKKVKTLLRKHSSSDMQLLAKWLQEKKLIIEIDKTFRLDEIILAHQYAEEGHSKGKNVILVQ